MDTSSTKIYLKVIFSMMRVLCLKTCILESIFKAGQQEVEHLLKHSEQAAQTSLWEVLKQNPGVSEYHVSIGLFWMDESNINF